MNSQIAPSLTAANPGQSHLESRSLCNNFIKSWRPTAWDEWGKNGKEFPVKSANATGTSRSISGSTTQAKKKPHLEGWRSSAWSFMKQLQMRQVCWILNVLAKNSQSEQLFSSQYWTLHSIERVHTATTMNDSRKYTQTYNFQGEKKGKPQLSVCFSLKKFTWFPEKGNVLAGNHTFSESCCTAAFNSSIIARDN